MGKKVPLLEVDPRCLPLGMRVGPWRIRGWSGRGANGSVYRVERAGPGADGRFALKMAHFPRDERFEREAWLLSRTRSPHVPRLHARGEWKHPFGTFPYLVMDWIEGEPLYDWAERHKPSSRQMLRVLAQVARALEAVHAIGGVHRDVKGDNVLVRPADGRAFLLDFGAGHYRGAATLTSKLLPPGTSVYRSPEAWAFLGLFKRHPTAHYPASTSDDLFALGVMAYRLVTDEYPPPTQPEEPGSEVWREGGAGPRPPRELNPNVSPELDALILRLLSREPVERFEGQSRKAAEALEQAGAGAETEGEGPPSSWEHERAEVMRPQVPRRPRSPLWGTEMAVAVLGLLLACLMGATLHRARNGVGDGSERASPEKGTVAVGDRSHDTSASTHGGVPTADGKLTVARALPETPLPGQSKPPCKRAGEVAIHGGCWSALRDLKPPCKEEGKEDAYDWKGGCYVPSYPVGREPTSDSP